MWMIASAMADAIPSRVEDDCDTVACGARCVIGLISSERDAQCRYAARYGFDQCPVTCMGHDQGSLGDERGVRRRPDDDHVP